MAVLRRTTKGKLAVKAAKAVAKNPELLRYGGKAAAPAAKLRFTIGKRRTRRQARRLGNTARAVGTTLALYAPQAARELGLFQAPKQSRRAPFVAAGVVLGATAVYFLEPAQGRQHRQQIRQLVG